jgi:hypothetical protein
VVQWPGAESAKAPTGALVLPVVGAGARVALFWRGRKSVQAVQKPARRAAVGAGVLAVVVQRGVQQGGWSGRKAWYVLRLRGLRDQT